MNVYEFDIWCGVKRNGEYSHTSTRRQLVHALNEARAKKKIVLAEAKTWGAGEQKIDVSNEYVYAVRRTGTVTKQMYYVYSDGRSARSVK